MVADVQSKLRLALGSVKDHASIGKAMIYNRDGLSCSIDIAVVRATGHDNAPMDDKHMHEILFLVSNSPGSLPYLAERISHRLEKTRDPVVAFKTLLLVHRLLRGGNRKFERDLRNAHLSGYLQFSTRWFPATSDHNNGSLFSFLHSYAAFLEERMSWVINQAGKLEPIMFQQLDQSRFSKEKLMEMVFHRLPRCQVFLDKVLSFSSPVEMIFPSEHCLTWVAMRNILRECFQVYVTFSEGIATLTDTFFNFNNSARVLAIEVLRKASSQSYELFYFFENCKRIIGTKNLDYPSVEIITSDHVSAMEQFLKSSSPTPGNCSLVLYTNLRTSPAASSPCWIHDNYITKSIKTYDQEAFSSSPSPSPSPSHPPPFTGRLETKISTAWVVFDNDDEEEEMSSSNFSAAIDRDVQIPCTTYYNPFVSCVEIRNGNFKRA